MKTRGSSVFVTLTKWDNNKLKHKWLHNLALSTDTYRSPYLHKRPEELLYNNTYSVEHVLPRDRIHNDTYESDPYGWVLADRKENRIRSNYPLLLWPRETPESIRVNQKAHLCTVETNVIDSNGTEQTVTEKHYEPPENEKARLARKWLYMRATYYTCVDPPSHAQSKHMANIVALCKNTPPTPTEIEIGAKVEQIVGFNNPLLSSEQEEIANTFYDNATFRALVNGVYKSGRMQCS